MTVSPELARIYASAPVDDRAFDTLEISHPAFTQVYYLTNEKAGFTATLETGETVDFIFLPFDIKLPSAGSNGFQDLTISISNVTLALIDELERAAESPTDPIAFVYRAYASSDLSAPGMVLPSMAAAQVVVDQTTVSAQASLVDLVNRNFPYQIYTPRLFPMLPVTS